MNTDKCKAWFRSRSLASRFFIVAFSVPLVWSILWGVCGLIAGTTKVDSPGSALIGVGLLLHLPAVIVVGTMAPAFPMGAGEDGGFEVMLLVFVTLPSSLAYGLVGWLFGKTMEQKT